MKKFTSKYSVLTSNGFQKFDGIKRTSKNHSIHIYFEDGTNIKVTENHKFYEGNSFINANSIKEGDTLSNKTVKKIEINEHAEEFFYDLLNVQNGNHYTTSGIESSNCAFIKFSAWDEFCDSIFPSQSSLAWKKNIIVSTANGQNHFYEMVEGAREESNGYGIFEVNWEDVPRYDQDGKKLSPEEFRDSVIKKNGILYFNQNYANEFLGSSKTLISTESIEEMQRNQKHHEYTIGPKSSKLKIFKEPEPEHMYIMGVDAAKDGMDSFSVQIIDITTLEFEQVASAKLDVDYLLMPEFLNEWGNWYNYAYMIIENNEGAGQSIADQLFRTFEYENLHYDRDTRTRKRKKYAGTRTTSKSRKQNLSTMKLFIENSKLKIYDRDTIEEFKRFIFIKNKFQADGGYHDDMVMSLAVIFTPFIDVKNFDDMKEVTDNLYAESVKGNSPKFIDMITFGDFHDGPEEQDGLGIEIPLEAFT